jgi:hypothetical protein
MFRHCLYPSSSEQGSNLRLGLEHDSRPNFLLVAEAYCPMNTTVFGFHILYRPGIQSPHGATGNTDGLFTFSPPLQAEITFLHPGILFSTKLGCLVRANLKATLAGIPAQT